MVLCRPELQFKRSLWTRIKRKLDKKHLSGKFVLQYDCQKLEDYVRKGLLKHYIGLASSESRFLKIPTEMYDEMRNEHLEEARGDTVLMILGGQNVTYAIMRLPIHWTGIALEYISISTVELAGS